MHHLLGCTYATAMSASDRRILTQFAKRKDYKSPFMKVWKRNERSSGNDVQCLTKFIQKISKNENNVLEKKYARMVFMANYSFLSTENFYVRDFFQECHPGFKVPNRQRLKILLDEEYLQIKEDVGKLIEKADYCSIVIDAWSNVRNEAIINIMVTTPTPVFYEMISCGSAIKDGEYYARVVSKVIDTIGKDKISGVVSDNAAVMIKMGEKLQRKYPGLIFGRCTAHIFNLLLQDILEIKIFADLFAACKLITKEVNISYIRGVFRWNKV
ncbi:uncharacterized protein B4U80_13347 [Leptotrombidium deliense]|uniref:DUF659 domain-containing protein n=1 Tax=Leptotrombidium deliense TaxID=299467 RepID=A0A443S7Z2_9ACAR|nr:uncharacterized protein B4U80_13347 [Leptotrombidium deliense]